MKYYRKHCGNLAYSNDMPHGGLCCGQPVQEYFEASHSSSAAQPAQRPARLQQEQRAGKREAEKHEQEHERQEKRLRETQPDLDVDVCMYWQSVENLEVQKRQIAKREKNQRRASRKVPPGMQGECRGHQAGASTESSEADIASSGNRSQGTSARVPVPVDAPVDPREDARGSGATLPANDRPLCAGVGDADSLGWACWSCLTDLCAKKPRMPLNALANDNWGGRERPHVRNASKATKMLASIGRCCWRQVRLAKGAPDVQQKGITGNTILFAQPTADIASMELPPAPDALVDSLNIAFSRSTTDLRKAEWGHARVMAAAVTTCRWSLCRRNERWY